MDRRSLLDRAAKSAEERVLLGHILDKYDQCRQRNLPTNTAFLSPAEAQGARDLLRAAAIHEGFALLGGYEGAERRMLFFLPDWQEEADASDAMAFLRAAWHESEHPTHRDLLGSLMALGEPPACSGAPAIRNAIYNATGVAIDQNPINPHILFKRFSEEGLIQD